MLQRHREASSETTRGEDSERQNEDGLRQAETPRFELKVSGPVGPARSASAVGADARAALAWRSGRDSGGNDEDGQVDGMGSSSDHCPGEHLYPLQSYGSLTYLQIISLQTLHYVTLSVLIPPLLVMFAEPGPLEYEGGAANVGMPHRGTTWARF